MVTMLDLFALDRRSIEFVLWLKVLQSSFGKVLTFCITSDILVGIEIDSSPVTIDIDALG